MNKILLSCLLLLSSAASAVSLDDVPSGFAKNVIVLIPDDSSVDVATLTRWAYYDGQPLNIDPYASGLMRTHNSDTLIGDSAPAGTAMATGYKTQDKLIGIRPAVATLYGATPSAPEQVHAPMASVLEAAKLAGKATGIVVTAEVQHATPADFSAHATHRARYTDIGEQQVHQGMDVVMGGGADYLLPDPKGSTDPKSKMRIDGENMQEVIKNKGYQSPPTSTTKTAAPPQRTSVARLATAALPPRQRINSNKNSAVMSVCSTKKAYSS